MALWVFLKVSGNHLFTPRGEPSKSPNKKEPLIYGATFDINLAGSGIFGPTRIHMVLLY